MIENAVTAWITDVVHHLTTGNIAWAGLRGQMLCADLEKLAISGSDVDGIESDLIANLKILARRALDELNSHHLESARDDFKRALGLWRDGMHRDSNDA